MYDRDDIEITIPDQEGWDADKEQFVNIKGRTIRMKHSLLSISKWEMKWKKPFLKPGYVMTPEELTDYYKCMTITQNVDPYVYNFIPESEKLKIKNYMDDPMSAYCPKKDKKSSSRASIVSERIYYWMVANNVPSSYEKWHLNRLLNLLEIAAEESSPERNKKVPLADVYKQNHSLNAARRKALHTRG